MNSSWAEGRGKYILPPFFYSSGSCGEGNQKPRTSPHYPAYKMGQYDDECRQAMTLPGCWLGFVAGTQQFCLEMILPLLAFVKWTVDEDAETELVSQEVKQPVSLWSAYNSMAQPEDPPAVICIWPSYHQCASPWMGYPGYSLEPTDQTQWTGVRSRSKVASDFGHGSVQESSESGASWTSVQRQVTAVPRCISHCTLCSKVLRQDHWRQWTWWGMTGSRSVQQCHHVTDHQWQSPQQSNASTSNHTPSALRFVDRGLILWGES